MEEEEDEARKDIKRNRDIKEREMKGGDKMRKKTREKKV